MVLVLCGGCFRYGFSGAEADGGWTDGRPRADASTPGDGGATEGRVDGPDAGGPRLDLGRDLGPDASSDRKGPLVNTGGDPLNTKAAGALTWSGCAGTFTGEAVLRDLAVGHVYQLKLEQHWSVDYQTGRALSSVCRTWDDTIWQVGDPASLLPSPHTGVGPGNVQAANIGDYLTVAEQDALFTANHDLLGYLVFSFFKVIDASTVEYTQDDSSPPQQIAAQPDGFHLPIHADFSWHTSAGAQKGAITLPAGDYNARFLVTREGDWCDPLELSPALFTVGSCP